MQPGRRESNSNETLEIGKRQYYEQIHFGGGFDDRLAAAHTYWWSAETSAAGASSLEGRASSSTGAAVAGVPVRARKNNDTFAVSVYTNSKGE